MRLLSEKKRDGQRVATGKTVYSSEKHNGVVEESSGPHFNSQGGHNFAPIKEESEESFRQAKKTKLPPINSKKQATKPENGGKVEPEQSQRKNFSAQKRADAAASKQAKVHSSQPSGYHPTQIDQSQPNSRERIPSTSKAGGVINEQLREASELGDNFDNRTERHVSGDPRRGAPVSGFTRTTAKSKRMPPDPNGFEKWYHKKLNSNV